MELDDERALRGESRGPRPPVAADQRRARQLSALVRVASIVARSDALEDILNLVAAEVRTGMGLSQCAVTLVDAHGAITTAGTSGLPNNYAEMLEQARARGVQIATVTAVQQKRIVVDPKGRSTILDDERWGPIQDLIRDSDLDVLIAVPFEVRPGPRSGEPTVGALTGFLSNGQTPDDEDKAFLRAMADHAAIAIENARMFRRLRIEAARDERRRLARDMHDSVTQALFSLSLHTRAAELAVQSGKTENLPSEIRQIHQLASDALTEMRSLIMHRRAAALGENGLVLALRRFGAGIEAKEGIHVRVVGSNEVWDLDEELEEDLFMMTGEAVRNAVKHASATSITVRVDREGPASQDLVIEILDDGIGFSQANVSSGSFGLHTMRERVTLHGGSLAVQRVDSPRGTRVMAVIPGILKTPPPPATPPNGTDQGKLND